MYIENLTLRGFRNYSEVSLTFEPAVNVIIGSNAQGKTNIMEAIYVLAMGKSHRTHRDKEMIGWESSFAHVKGNIHRRTGPTVLDVIFTPKGKTVKVNELEQQKLSQYIGTLNVVMFAPEDLNLVKGGPAERRRFIDMEIGQASPVYLHDLASYNRVLKQRNQFLKDWQGSRRDPGALLDVLNEQLAAQAAAVVKRRFEFIQMLQGWAEEIHRGISRGKEQLEINYVPSADVSYGMDLSTLKEAYEQAFQTKRDQEMRRGTTLSGPHREDLLLYVNGRNVQTYGSQGQQRTTALSLKLAEIELIRDQIGEYPVLLLDDVLSELDNHRQSHLLNTIQGKVQTFVTTTSVDGIQHETLSKASIFEVSDGQLVEVK
ncbi:DNA replication and repair protein RecF [Salsuginibacillus halophilus]|uniref:DNA replication and repair protein RecF n=1 Tax=Salsuginibacillus halophilus TaxID=517424 RepID=A0A2P8HIB0_9BACI|nr:DNA replication/repair protein RecF [Salsuginibacillus halophilus]PSL45945.1 DNA replication and repair protein RecF [Salsuginibacillus halophilus]